MTSTPMLTLARALRVQQGALVSFTGAGGKTTAMLRLGTELAASGLRVLATTTTRLGLEQLSLFPKHLVAPRPVQIEAALKRHRFILAVRGLDSTRQKALGFEPETVASFCDLADVVLVESDGSRGLPLKAPAPHEPVIPPAATHVVTVAGLWALDRPLDNATVHRADIAARLTGVEIGATISPPLLARLLLHPSGPARGAPPQALRYYLLNHTGAEGDERISVLALRLATATGVCGALTGSLLAEPPVQAAYGKTAAIVLAAGASTRFGSPKQLHPWQGTTLLRHVVEQALAAPVQALYVVLGAYFDAIAPTLAGLPVSLVYNPRWQDGQSSSVRAGLRALSPDTQAVLFILGDQPYLPADLLARLVDTHTRTLAPIVAPRYRGRRGNPVLFDRCCFDQLMALQGDTGGRPLFQQYRQEIAWVEADAGILADIDTPPGETA